jgi:hypothetical protein
VGLEIGLVTKLEFVRASSYMGHSSSTNSTSICLVLQSNMIIGIIIGMKKKKERVNLMVFHVVIKPSLI